VRGEWLSAFWASDGAADWDEFLAWAVEHKLDRDDDDSDDESLSRRPTSRSDRRCRRLLSFRSEPEVWRAV